MSNVKSPLEMFYQWEQQTPDKVYLRQPRNREWHEYTWAQVADRVRRIAGYLRNQNYPEGSRIAIWSSNSMDWPIVDLSIMLAGHISVPIYPGQDVASANYILNHSASRAVFCGSFDQAGNIDKALPAGVNTIAMLGCSFDCDQSIENIIKTCDRYEESPVPDPEAIFTIIYTSGTTGNPKGVMHMHQTPGHVIPGVARSFGIDDSTRMFSFLPMSHAAERIIVELMSIYTNTCVSFSEGLETFGDEMRSVQPTFFFAVPRLWVKLKEGVDVKIPPSARANLSDEQKLGIATQLGLGQATCILTGSAPTPRDVQEWFLDKGIILREGYGMTENFVHGIAWTKDDKPIPGCVGQPMASDVQVRISDAGEIQFKSKGLMKGYYLNPEKTAEVFTDDGWYCTGDSGKIEDGNFWVTGRISEVFKTSKGKFIVPTRLEDKYARSDELAQLLITGHGYDQPLLLVTLSETGKTLDQGALLNRLEALVDEVNAKVPAHERVSQAFVTPEWTIENSLLTPTMKVKRTQIFDHYRDQIDAALGKERVTILS